MTVMIFSSRHSPFPLSGRTSSNCALKREMRVPLKGQLVQRLGSSSSNWLSEIRDEIQKTREMSGQAENKCRSVVQAMLKRQCRLWAGVLGRRSDGVLVRFPLATAMVRGCLGVLGFQGSTDILHEPWKSLFPGAEPQ